MLLIYIILITSDSHAKTQNVNKSNYAKDSFDSSIDGSALKKYEQKLESYTLSLMRLTQTTLELESRLTKSEKISDSLSSRLELDETNIGKMAKDLGLKIKETGSKSEAQLIIIDDDLQKSRFYWIIVSLITLLIGIVMFVFLGKRIKLSKTDIETQINNTKSALEEESLKLDGQLVKIFQQQLELMDKSSKGISIDDHSLVLKIADRLTAMETNLYRMDTNTRGLNVLKNLVKSTKENFSAKEYEIVDMLGKEYKEGMEVIATFIPSEEIELGKQIITKIIKPQVNFKGKKIQAAQIEVSIGE
jgi:hypothetical protein